MGELKARTYGRALSLLELARGQTSSWQISILCQVRASIGSIDHQTDFGYTGQSNDTYTDLMDYKSRFYDGSLGRFIEPDTIVPNLADPQNLNRYAYVGNSPTNQIDPSGHSAECIRSGPYGCAEYAGLEQMAGSEGLSNDGMVMYKYFFHLRATKHRNLTADQFFGLMTMYEINGLAKAQKWDVISAADELFPSNHGKDKPNPYCPPTLSSCVAGLYNYLGTYSYSAMGHATSHNDALPPMLPANSTGYIMDDAQKITKDIFLNQKSEKYFDGIHYGNDPVWLPAARKNLRITNDPYDESAVLDMEGSWVAYSVTQENFWLCVMASDLGSCK